MKARLVIFTLFIVSLFSCGGDTGFVPPSGGNEADLTIFFINDQHGSINNFAKVKAIVSEARINGNALLVSAGDIFSGNPIVDQYSEQGFPMIDIMNEAGFDVGVLGNHEFDFGLEVLEARINESDFPWILANVDAAGSAISQPDPFVTLSIGDFRVTFLGLVETNGKEGDIIPSTHPYRVADLTFQRHEEVVNNYADLKSQQDADLLVALTHLGSEADRQLATNAPFFDLIIGGHSHQLINEAVNGIPVVQAGANLQLLGKIELRITDKEITDYSVSMIDLNQVTEVDAELEESIREYNANPAFRTVVGQSDFNHQSLDVGCFYTTALKEYMEVDFTIQNLGGIRAGINQGPITRFEIFTMDPFNNGSMSFTMSVGEYESFFCATGARFSFTGINVDGSAGDFQIVDDNGVPLPDDQELTMGVNDYIPAIYDSFFDLSKANIRDYTTAEAIIGYLQNINPTINFAGCARLLQCN